MKIFEKDGQKIIWGEALESIATIEDGSVDLVFADPPYNIGKKFNDLPDHWESDNSYLKLLERIIKASSNEGDLVLDPFSGTFTTSYVAQKLKRKSIGIEINEDYVKIGLRRLQITTEYEGQPLRRERKSYELSLDEKQAALNKSQKVAYSLINQ